MALITIRSPSHAQEGTVEDISYATEPPSGKMDLVVDLNFRGHVRSYSDASS
ncbi:MAG: hypothetical protein R2682_13645 [Pyrinomonadaceae bacterium]